MLDGYAVEADAGAEILDVRGSPRPAPAGEATGAAGGAPGCPSVTDRMARETFNRDLADTAACDASIDVESPMRLIARAAQRAAPLHRHDDPIDDWAQRTRRLAARPFGDDPDPVAGFVARGLAARRPSRDGRSTTRQ